MPLGRSNSPTHQIGAKAEDAAKAMLMQAGFTIVQTNYKSCYGEIDIIATLKQLIIFVEVKHRKIKSLVTATESITIKKQQNIIQTAQIFLQQHACYQDYDMRFDVIGSTGEQSGDSMLDWITAAFTL